jgi:hypothetical protein
MLKNFFVSPICRSWKSGIGEVFFGEPAETLVERHFQLFEAKCKIKGLDFWKMHMYGRQYMSITIKLPDIRLSVRFKGRALEMEDKEATERAANMLLYFMM